MHLKSLTVKGFKSFADKSALLFEPGVTIVVGPNGSGKSNISDAVMWVLGEQSAKALRGQAMEDVIFAGSSARQAVGVAEVDLVLDNSCSTLPLEFNEITITRRMYRSGESEYFLNNSPCRLMDIHELLHDVGLGRDTHSIISQGQLDEVLSSKPEDRRALIEEAAGVLKHKKRKDRAARKLNSMDAYLERARDVISEVDRQLRPLARQADKASAYSDINTELKELEVQLAVDDLRALQDQWKDVGKQEREQDAEIELLRYRLQEKERELGKFQSLLEEKGLFVGDLSEQRRRLQSILERNNSGLLLLEEKGKNLIERVSELRQKLHHSETRSVTRISELERLTEDRQGSDGQLKAHYSHLGELRRETETAKKERLFADEELGRITGETRRARKELEDARMELSVLEQGLTSAQMENELLEGRREGIREQRGGISATLSARRSRLEQLEAQLTRTQKERRLADADVDKRVRVIDSRRKELAERRDALTAARGEMRGLEEVDRAFATASPALAWALARQQALPALMGPLAERISVPVRYERLVEHVLGSDLFAVLVRDSASAVKMAEEIGVHAEGELALLPLDSLTAVRAESVGGTTRLAEEIKCDPEIRPVVEALLGDVLIAEDLKAAVALRQTVTTARLATVEGEVVWPSGKITAGRAVSDSAGVLERKRRINELTDDAAALSSRVGETESAVAEGEEALRAAQQDALELGQQLATLSGERDSLREEVGRLEAALTQFDVEASQMAQRISALVDRMERQAPSRGDLTKGIERLGSELEAFEEQATVARELRDNRFRDEAAINERLSQCQIDIATVSEREVHLKRQITTIVQELKDLERTITQARVTEEALELLRERIQPIHDLYAALLERAEHWAEKLRDRASFEQADSESLRTTIHAAQDAVRAVQTEIDEQSATMSDIRVAKGQLEVQVNTAAARIVEELGVPLETALTRESFDDRSHTQDRVYKLRKKLANLGPVNPIAMHEYQSLKDRREFLATQIEDLVESRKALSKVIAAIDRKMRDRFLETFEDVDTNFQKIFGVLFPGGHASLALTEPDDPENTGVEVVAQPVGKKLAKMSLMSGGEKSLTALALLFALYRTRPCPFYILDEVEAALDDTNLRRFVAFVDTMRAHTQFIVVSHQRRTMEMADVLYGVSMQADGVSKIVSQKLERTADKESVDEPAVV